MDILTLGKYTYIYSGRYSIEFTENQKIFIWTMTRLHNSNNSMFSNRYNTYYIIIYNQRI